MNFKEGEVLYFNKPLGWTSFKVVGHARYHICRRIKEKKLKVGHAGTLDPLATGVMIVCTGKATKRIEEFQYHTKEYVATIRLGATTPSYDLEHEIDATYPTEHITRGLVEETLKKFIGEIQQVPPAFSACMVNGKRAYDLARKGEEVELKPKLLVIDEIELLDDGLDIAEPWIKVRVVCSKGTYIRTLCQDIGEKLGCGAAMASLVRTQVDRFQLEDALTLERIEALQKENELEPFILPVDQLFEYYDKIVVADKAICYLQNGNKINAGFCQGNIPGEDGKKVRMYDTKDRFYAIYRWDAGQNVFVNDKMFFPHTEA